MLRIVLDTNVLVSAIITEGKSQDLLKLAIQRQFLLIKSKEIIDEFTQVLQRPKFGMTRREVIEAKNALMKIGKTIKVTSNRKVVKEDPDDDIFINAALDGNADCIISGDPHLLNIANYKGIEIMTVDVILKRLSPNVKHLFGKAKFGGIDTQKLKDETRAGWHD